MPPLPYLLTTTHNHPTSSGISLALARLLAARGQKISIADISQANLDKASDTMQSLNASGKDVFATKVNLRDFSAVHSRRQSTVDALGEIKGAANLAAVHASSFIAELEAEIRDQVTGVDSTGLMHYLNAEGSLMTAGDCIVDAFSVSGLRGQAENAAFCASEHAVIDLTQAAATEGGPKGIRVNFVVPRFAETLVFWKRRGSGRVVRRLRCGLRLCR